MKIRRALRAVPETLLMGLGLAVIPWLPRRWVVRLARGIGGLGPVVCPGLARIGRANLDVAFGASLSPARKAGILRESFRTFTLVVLDLFWFSAFRRRRMARHFSFDASTNGVERIRPLLGLTAHLGNWELLGQALAAQDMPLLSVAAPLANPLADRLIRWMRGIPGHSVTRRQGSVRLLLRELKRGGRVALLLDQNTTPREGGEFVQFFGLPTPISRVAAVLRERTPADLVLAACVPDTTGHYTVYALPVLSLRAPGLPPDRTTQAIADMTEEMIRRFPEHWLWTYKRWRYIPRGADPSRFPYYAHALHPLEDARPAAGSRAVDAEADPPKAATK